MYVSAVLNTARPERCRLLTTEEAARLTVEGWAVGDSVTLSDGAWTFIKGDRLATSNVTEERVWARISRNQRDRLATSLR